MNQKPTEAEVNELIELLRQVRGAGFTVDAEQTAREWLRRKNKPEPINTIAYVLQSISADAIEREDALAWRSREDKNTTKE